MVDISVMIYCNKINEKPPKRWKIYFFSKWAVKSKHNDGYFVLLSLLLLLLYFGIVVNFPPQLKAQPKSTTKRTSTRSIRFGSVRFVSPLSFFPSFSRSLDTITEAPPKHTTIVYHCAHHHANESVYTHFSQK